MRTGLVCLFLVSVSGGAMAQTLVNSSACRAGTRVNLLLSKSGGSPSYYNCTPCLAGTYTSSSHNGTNCTACANGAYASASNSTGCRMCGLGTYASGRGATRCDACDHGVFQSALGASACVACPTGQYTASAAASVCKTCPSNSIPYVQVNDRLDYALSPHMQSVVNESAEF